MFPSLRSPGNIMSIMGNICVRNNVSSFASTLKISDQYYYYSGGRNVGSCPISGCFNAAIKEVCEAFG